jgi:hypothetical protein
VNLKKDGKVNVNVKLEYSRFGFDGNKKGAV